MFGLPWLHLHLTNSQAPHERVMRQTLYKLQTTTENYCAYSSTRSIQVASVWMSRINQALLPATRSVRLPTSVVQSALGLPTLRTNLSVAGVRDTGLKVTCFITLPSGCRVTLPYRRSCCRSNALLKRLSPVATRT